MSDLTPTVVTTIADIVRRADARVTFVDPSVDLSLPHRVPLAVTTHPSGAVEVRDLKPYIDAHRPIPLRRTGTAHAYTRDSFIALVTHHAARSTRIFADAGDNQRPPRFMAVIDYHEAADAALSAYDQFDPQDDGARWGQHRVVYTYRTTRAWDAWCKVDGERLSQGDFARFLEERAGDLAVPEPEEDALFSRVHRRAALPVDILTAARGLDLTAESAVRSRTNLATGEVEFLFEESHKGRGGEKVSVPSAAILSVQAYEGGDTVRIPLRLSYRLNEGRITWTMTMLNAADRLRDAVESDARLIETATGCPVWYGAPEVP